MKRDGDEVIFNTKDWNELRLNRTDIKTSRPNRTCPDKKRRLLGFRSLNQMPENLRGFRTTMSLCKELWRNGMTKTRRPNGFDRPRTLGRRVALVPRQMFNWGCAVTTVFRICCRSLTLCREGFLVANFVQVSFEDGRVQRVLRETHH